MHILCTESNAAHVCPSSEKELSLDCRFSFHKKENGNGILQDLYKESRLLYI